MAEAALRAELAKAGRTDILVHSAGISAWPGAQVSPQAVLAGAEENLDISGHRAQPLDDDLMAQSDLIMAMTQDQVDLIRRRWPAHAPKVLRLFPEPENGQPRWSGDVPDPVGLDVDEYRTILGLIREGIQYRLPCITA